MDTKETLQGVIDNLTKLRDTIEATPAPPATTPDGGALITTATLRSFATSIPIPTTNTPMNPWQFAFTVRVAALLMFAHMRGYRITFGNARTDRGCTTCGGGKRKATSLHFEGLAVDLNLFKQVNGRWEFQTRSDDHKELGEFWESIGGAWGGRFNDGNHYSLAYNGRK